ncbi:FAD-dependent oxidoreductase, partial [Acinetobacter baumannii]
ASMINIETPTYYTATKKYELSFPSLETDLDADVVVIGAGVTGALLATRLAKTGKSVLLLESGPRMGRDQLVERFRSSAF